MLRSLWHVARLARYPPDAANHTWSVLYFASCICGIASRAALPDDGRDPNGALDTLDLTTDALSPREIEIARHYAEGATYHEIAAALGIAPSTVRTHLAAIYRKLGVSSKLELHARLDGDRPAPRDQIDHGAVISELALSLEEALAREKAVSEVLRIIGGARGDIDAVMPAILGYALRLCDAEYGGLFDYVGGGRFRVGHMLGIPPPFRDWLTEQGDFRPGPETGLGRMATSRAAVSIFDVRAEAVYRSDDPLRWATATLGGARSFVAIPMLAGDDFVGAFVIYRQQVRPFSDATTELARSFAAQSVIAIENARLVGALRQAEDARGG
jgi:DNA-binding CsgD family transcriptional regulator